MDILPVIPEIRIWIQTIASIILVIIAIWSYKRGKKEKEYD
ncbi:MAG TPA: hypothetical protein VK426_02105 [Methanobacterium sp.]|nr:hypothetical protein [Methanobacterium sp.]